ncbi:hypothetical protein I9W82_000383 [Candida metapsilosis]|uniref:Uncharacterized protein n=1 Tax=Candida metapsilosis TaxID=273372 RepID=A0A8H7ZKI2_9ASCO|nr:hypothetical protein I9W82_000383 [Candida metapsilosis]
MFVSLKYNKQKYENAAKKRKLESDKIHSSAKSGGSLFNSSGTPSQTEQFKTTLKIKNTDALKANSQNYEQPTLPTSPFMPRSVIQKFHDSYQWTDKGEYIIMVRFSYNKEKYKERIGSKSEYTVNKASPAYSEDKNNQSRDGACGPTLSKSNSSSPTKKAPSNSSNTSLRSEKYVGSKGVPHTPVNGEAYDSKSGLGEPVTKSDDPAEPKYRRVSFTYNKEKYQVFLESKTSESSQHTKSGRKSNTDSPVSGDEMSNSATSERSSISSKASTHTTRTNTTQAETSEKSKDTADPISNSRAHFTSAPKEVENAKEAKNVKMVTVRYPSTAKRSQTQPSTVVGENKESNTSASKSDEKVQESNTTATKPIQPTSQPSVIPTKPTSHGSQVVSKLRRKSSVNSRARPNSTPSTVSSSDPIQLSSPSASRSSTPDSSSSLSSSSSSPSQSQLPDSEPVVAEESDVAIDESQVDTPKSGSSHQPQRSTIETCEVALDTMSRYSDLQAELSNSTLEKVDLNSHQQAEIDWFKSLIVVAEKLNNLKDTYKAIQMIKRKKAATS